MTTNTITGNGTLILWNRVFSNFADGDAVKLTFSDDLIKNKTGKNQNTVYSRNESGHNAVGEFRILRGSPDDKYFRSQLSSITGEKLAQYVLGEGRFVRELGDGLGNVVYDTYELAGGIIQKNPDTTENTDGDTNQAVITWMVRFARITPSIQ